MPKRLFVSTSLDSAVERKDAATLLRILELVEAFSKTLAVVQNIASLRDLVRLGQKDRAVRSAVSHWASIKEEACRLRSSIGREVHRTEPMLIGVEGNS
jgi:hypothetical protein